MSEDTVVLGKRKQRDADEPRLPGSTLFVSNLPYTATSTDLQTLFSDFAPVRSAFVVLEGSVSKGVGYVSFAIKEDAKTTLDAIEKDGLELNGRKLRVQMADRKPKENIAERKVKPEHNAPPAAHVHHPKLPKDPNAIRTIVISGLPASIDKKVLWKKVRKYEGSESVELIEGEPGVAHALFSSPSTASHAVDKLHAHVFKGSILSVGLKKRLENLARPSVKEGHAPSAAPSRASRLIVRNLPWNITEKDLRALFLPFGPIYSVNIPLLHPPMENPTSKHSKPRAKGFAFVWFFSKKDAEQAIAGVNGRAVEAGSIVAPTLNKKERQRLRRQLREKAKDGSEEDTEDEDEGGPDDEDVSISTEKAPKVGGGGSRVLAVDWALSKDKWEEAKAKTLDEQREDSEDGPESEAQPDSEKGSDSGSESDDASEIDEENEERSDIEEAVRPTLPQTDVGTTLFVRNLPFDATEDELRVLFRTFGPLRYARITVDVDTGRSRGTGFVCFWNKEDADKAIQQSELLSREAGIIDPAAATKKKNPFSLPSLLTPDPSSSLARPLVLHGRTLDVTRAVTRDEAAKLKDEGERQREKADKRNLYLLREGVIFPGSPAATSLTAAELEKRQASFNARRNLLKSNPLLYVSKTRLSIRQIPLFVSDRTLKRLAIHAMRAFEEEVKHGEREPLSAEELRADDDVVLPEDGAEKKKRRKGKKAERETGVKQAKVVRQADRVDPLTGKGRSRGYGFLEMTRHGDALRVLRWSNNNQSLHALLEGWWKEEVEDLLKGLEAGMTKQESKAGGDGESGEDLEARIRRLKGELERLKSGEGRSKGNKKTLIVEFSIENAQVVNRRKEKIEATKSASKRPRSSSVVSGDGDEQDDVEATSATTTKRRKTEKSSAARSSAKADTKSEASEGGPTKPGKFVGSIIGRKRKMRKARGKGK